MGYRLQNTGKSNIIVRKFIQNKWKISVFFLMYIKILHVYTKFFKFLMLNFLAIFVFLKADTIFESLLKTVLRNKKVFDGYSRIKPA